MNVTYPQNVRIFLDNKDITFHLVGAETINPTDDKSTWRNLNLTDLVKTPGIHTLKITCEAGAGRADAKVEIK